MTIEQTIREFVRNTFLIGQEDFVLREDTSFLQAGLIDSTGVLELVNFIEEHFGIKIEDDELVPENLDSIDQITRFLTDKIVVAENAA